MDNNIIFNKIEAAFLKVFSKLKETSERDESPIFVRMEQHQPAQEVSYHQYIIEIVVKEKINSDEYGVVYTLNLEDIGNGLTVGIEVSRSNGYILSSQDYHLTEGKHGNYNDGKVEEVINYINTASTHLLN
ncbi:hypothetical protein [Paraflavitalea speifideaquila]|uniref:hypothetical protein n=1 Tax=Paraflavitalea speifideaquila TaxID=3076558 RepID=UPI0028E60524|nr:hypothetical protein [Paraflavitalea speifideiaquila]